MEILKYLIPIIFFGCLIALVVHYIQRKPEYTKTEPKGVNFDDTNEYLKEIKEIIEEPKQPKIYGGGVISHMIKNKVLPHLESVNTYWYAPVKLGKLTLKIKYISSSHIYHFDLYFDNIELFHGYSEENEECHWYSDTWKYEGEWQNDIINLIDHFDAVQHHERKKREKEEQEIIQEKLAQY